MCARVRMVVVSMAFLSLAFSCSEGGSYVVDTTESSRIISVLDRWASKKGFTGTGCAKYYTPAIEGTCYRLGESERVTESFLAAEEIEPSDGIRVWISFKGITESQRTETLDSLGAALSSEFGSGRVRLEK